MESAGARLKNKRLEKGLSLEEVQKKTKIHLNILKAIEEDSLVGVSPIYTKGFLKIYCKFLGLDPADYISEYKQPQAKPAFTPVKENLRHVSLWPFVIKFIRPGLIIVTAFFILFLAGRLIRNLKARSSLRPQKQQTRLPAVKPAPKVPLSGTIRLGISARDNTYLTLKSDGRVVFQGLLRKGAAETWEAKEKIEFSLNNAAGVRLQINGRSISELGAKRQAIKGIITKEGGLTILR